MQSISHSERALVKANPQTFPRSTPPSKSYEFALHGLLALGSTSVSNPDMDVAPASVNSPDQEISTFDFARGEDADPVSNAKSYQTVLETYQTRQAHQPALSFGGDSRSLPGLSPDFRKLDVTGDLYHSHEALIIDEERSSKDSQADLGAAGPKVELLKIYRYNIAPWLDICDADQHFGVELLTISRRVPRLRTCVMRLAAASSSIAWLEENLNVDITPSLEATNDATDLDLNVEAIVGVLDLLIETIPDLAASWSRQKQQKHRSHVMETLLLELEHSNMHACAYWMAVRLGIVHP